MLKALVQLFAEKFLQNKSEWVGGQSFPNTTSTWITVQHAVPYQYTPPKDGYIRLGGDLNAVNIGMRGTLACVIVNTKGYLQGFIPVKKGISVRLYCETTDKQPLYAEFFPLQGG